MALLNWLLLFIIVCSLFIAVMGVISAFTWRRLKRNIALIQAHWLDEATPVEPVEIVLRTGERVWVKPVNPHKGWYWTVPVPAEPDMVEEVIFPDLPPWTNLIPVPPSIQALREGH